MAHELFFGYGMLPVREMLEVLLLHFTVKAPLVRQFAVPFTMYSIALGVVILLGVRELLFVIRLRLGRTNRLGDGQHRLLAPQTCPCHFGEPAWHNKLFHLRSTVVMFREDQQSRDAELIVGRVDTVAHTV